MTDDQIERMIADAPPSTWQALGSIPAVARYCERKMEEERETCGLINVMMTCYMPQEDALRYAEEARACVGLGWARDAALAGRPYLLPWRGPVQ